MKSSYFDLPPMEISAAFPQATPASKFPPCSKDLFSSRYYYTFLVCCSFVASNCFFFVFSVLDTASDYYNFNDLLTPEEQAVRKRVREFMEKEVAPIMTEVNVLIDIFMFRMLFLFVYLIVIIVSHNCSCFDFYSSVLGEGGVSFPYHSKVWSFGCCWWLHQGFFQCFVSWIFFDYVDGQSFSFFFFLNLV